MFHLILTKSEGDEYWILILEGNFLREWDKGTVNKNATELNSYFPRLKKKNESAKPDKINQEAENRYKRVE